MKSDKDAMVYFFGRLPQGYYAQKEIDIEKSKGKIIKISNIDAYKDEFRIDFGFENYCPTNIPMYRDVRENGVIYLDNLYEKMKVQLVPNEKLYIYSSSDVIDRLNIEYIGKNLNNKNNDYNIFLIPNNNEENTLIINTAEANYLIADLFFCKSDTTLNLKFLGENNEEELTYTNENFTEKDRAFLLYHGDNKMTFRTNQPVVFTYSYYDLIDDELFNDKKNAYWNERREFSGLKIEEIADKDINNIMKIKFKPNYKQSSTRYIILVAQKNSENTLENFKDPCFVTGLLNQRPKGVKVDVIYDVGDNDSVNAEVRITDILSDNNEYIVTIISQELRFNKKIHFYEPKEFRHEKEEDSSETSDTSEPPETGSSNPSNDGKENNNNTSLALGITLPIIGVLLIVIIVLIVLFRRKSTSSRDIEGMSKLNDLTGNN